MVQMYAGISVKNTSLFSNLYPILTVNLMLTQHKVNIEHIIVKYIQVSYTKYLYFCGNYSNYEKY